MVFGAAAYGATIYGGDSTGGTSVFYVADNFNIQGEGGDVAMATAGEN
jgi:hypothetical protein